MTSLLELLAAEVGPSGQTFPAIERIRDSLSPEDLSTLDAALADPSVPTTALARALRGKGHAISTERLGAYRRSLR